MKKNNGLRKVALAAFAVVGLASLSVQARESSGSSGPSLEAPKKPFSITVTDRTTSSISFYFNEVTGSETGFRLEIYQYGRKIREYWDGPQNSHKNIPTGRSLHEYTIGSLRSGTKYTFKLITERRNCDEYKPYYIAPGAAACTIADSAAREKEIWTTSWYEDEEKDK